MATEMLVNGVNISTCNAKFWSITPAARTVTNATEILDGASMPVMMPPAFGTKEYTLKLNVYGEGRKEIWENASRLLQLFSEVVDVSISGFSDNGNQRFFKLSLTKVSQEEYGPGKGRWDALTLSCTGYEYGRKAYLWSPCLQLNKSGNEGILYEDYIENMTNEFHAGQTQMATAPVLVDVIINQGKMCSDAEEAGVAPEVQGKNYALHANIRISGLCRNSAGKDAGDMTIDVREHMEPDGNYAGRGITHIEIEGKTGKLKERTANAEGNWGRMEYSMPSQLKAGFPGQKIRVEIDNPDKTTIYRQQDIYIVLGLTPVYL